MDFEDKAAKAAETARDRDVDAHFGDEPVRQDLPQNDPDRDNHEPRKEIPDYASTMVIRAFDTIRATMFPGFISARFYGGVCSIHVEQEYFEQHYDGATDIAVEPYQIDGAHYTRRTIKWDAFEILCIRSEDG